jgi:hypothetical protein
MSGFVIRQDYRTEAGDAGWSYLQQTPHDRSWGWTGGSDTATVIAPVAAQHMATYLLGAGLQVRILPDYYQRTPTVLDVPQQFQVAA